MTPTPPKTVMRTIMVEGDGSCVELIDVECPPPEEATCNPPPPMPVACPKTTISQVRRDEAGVCTQSMYFDRCPEDARCQPIPDQTIDCPPQLTSEGAVYKRAYGCYVESSGGESGPKECPPQMKAPADTDYIYTPLNDGLCQAVFSGDIHCPPDASCNPPPPQRVICPPGVTK
ncbi:MAG: hypothetical protein AAFV53_34195 [Myxococcota bacterium]